MGQDRPINALLPGFAQVHVFNSTRITPFIPVYMPIAMYLGVFAHNTPRSRVSACFHLPSTASTALHVLSKCQTRLSFASNLRRRTSLILRMALRWAGIGSPMKIGQLKLASSSSSAHRADHIPIEADRAFRIVTAHSGHGRKSVNFEQNPRSASSRITGQVRSESAVNLVRNTQNRVLVHMRTTVCARPPKRLRALSSATGNGLK